jgi:hypothetical protein
MGRSINAGTGKLAVAIKNAELQQKCRKFLLRTPISMTLDSAKSLSRGLVIPSKKTNFGTIKCMCYVKVSLILALGVCLV